MPLMLLIQQVAAFIEAGITTRNQVRDAIAQAKASIADADGRELTADEVEANLDALLARGAAVGDNAAARLEDLQ